MEVTRKMLDELDTYELKLLLHYALNAQDGKLVESVRETVVKAGISAHTVIRARDGLRDKGYLASVRTFSATEIELA